MSIIYSYPIKGTPANDDLILISDSASSPQFATKQIKVSSLPGGSASGVSSFNTLTGAVTITGGTNVTLNPVGNNIEINAAGGSSGISVQGAGGTPITGITTLNFRHNFAVGAVGTTATMDVLPYGNDTEIQFKNGTAFGASPNLTFTTNTLAVTHTVDIKGDGVNAGKLKLYCENTTTPHAITLEGPAHSGGADYTLKFPSAAPTNNQILQYTTANNLGWIATPSGGGGGAVDSVVTTNGTYINLTPTTASTAAVTVTADLSAVNGTSTTTTKFLSKDNTWDVPSYTTNTDTNIANTQLQLDNNRTLDLSNGDATDYDLTFISNLGGVSKNLFKFDQIGGTSPQFTVGHTESAYEGYITLEGNGSSRTGILKFENALGTYYTSFQAPTTFGANQNIGYTLPNLQGAANSVLTNNGSGALSWTTTSQPAEITSTTAVNSTTFANTPFTFANTNGGSGIGAPVAIQVSSSYGNKHMAFYLGTVFSGSINQSGANTVNYATSSDYRLKENVVEMTGSVDRVKQLNPSKFNFIADGPSRTVDGFLAHEVSDIVPEAITGSKDAIDAEGNIIPQGIDQSKLVPLLVGAIKELTARIEALEA